MAKNKKFPIGSIVYQKFDGQPFIKATVMSLLIDNQVVIEGTAGGLYKVNIDTLLSEKEGLAEIKALKEKEKLIEEKFEKVRLELINKLDEAANLINQANALARANNISLIYDDVSYVLERALTNAGWNTSSMNC